MYFKTILSCIFIYFLTGCSDEAENRLHVYNWTDSIDMQIVKDFEEETGIKVIYDVYESNDVLEAKLLTGNSGYDIVVPSAYPYFARQVESGVYTKLDPAKIPNMKLLDKELVKKLNKIPTASEYAIPFLWGITVIGYRADLVKKTLPNAPVDSLRMFYDKDVIKPLSKCGIAYLEEPVDIIPLALFYLKFSPNSTDDIQIAHAVDLLKKLRPYVTQFSANRPLEDLISGDICVSQNWMGAILEIKHRVKDMKNPPDIRVSIPKEGTSMWLDVIAIPKDSTHKENAYKFIDFLLRPENMAKVTNKTFNFNAVPTSSKFLKKSIREQLALDPSVRKKIFQTEMVSKEHTKKLTRALQSIVSGN